MQGDLNSETDFQYVKIAVKACTPTESSFLSEQKQAECASKEVIASQIVNIVTLQAHANIFASHNDESNSVVEYVSDMSHPQALDPNLSQTLNMAFFESTVSIQDTKLDIFEVADEWTTKFVEFSKSWKY